MKLYSVEFSRRADSQLEKLYRFLLQKTDERIVLRYMEDLVSFCMELSRFPHRGNIYAELGEDVRVIGFRRSVSVQFRVRETRVQVLNIAYRGEDYAAFFEKNRP
ncbi:type II toxin-antitoxin system RelE/ParE family toxin [Terriglobus sp. RCC_193]|uniref:type II toxin-antitoxin system RelE/ParE family toxin n=1 Tax=Terriglobus sp. RCC_193 TaxID=3239218 RepID=UPI0035259DDA